MPFSATCMDLEIIILTEVSQTEKVKYDMISMWNLKNYTNELMYKTETTQRLGNDGYQREKVAGRNKLTGWD